MEQCWSFWDKRDLGKGVTSLCLSKLQLPVVHILPKEFGNSDFFFNAQRNIQKKKKYLKGGCRLTFLQGDQLKKHQSKDYRLL